MQKNSPRGKTIPAADGTSVATESSAMACTTLMMSVYSYRLYRAVKYGMGFDLPLAQKILSFVLGFAIQFQQPA